jgi:hypothetical protein
MRHHTRALAIVLSTVALAAGCSRAAHDQRTSQAQTPPPPAVPAPGAIIPPPTGLGTLTEGVAPIPGHPPITTSGVVKSFDHATMILTFQDGRMVKITDQTQVQPAVGGRLRPGEQVIVTNAMPVGVWDPSQRAALKTTLNQQRMGTVASVDEPGRTVSLTDGSTVNVPSSTRIHMGTAGTVITLGDVHPGDELVVIMVDSRAPTADVTAPATPSALPRDNASAMPTVADEMMVFRKTVP